jgi:hypothetical protein
MEPNPVFQISPFLIIAVALVFFVLFWAFVIFILSTASGWRRLAKTFRAQNSVQGDRFTWQSGRFRLVNYNRILNITVCREGLLLSVIKLFSPLHPALFIPWEAVRNVSLTSIFFMKYVRFEIADGKGTVKVHLSAKVLESPHWAVRPN